MSILAAEVVIDEGRRVFAPGDQVAGRVSWHLEEDPEEVSLRLLWRTEGRGSQDVEVVGREEFGAPGLRDQRSFSFRLPAGPYSFSGSLISLIWGLELVAEPQGALVGVDFTVSHGAGEVRLLRVDGEADGSDRDRQGSDDDLPPVPEGGGWGRT